MSTPAPAASPSLLRRYLNIPLIWKMAVALVAGAVAGLVINAAGVQERALAVLDPLGEIFLNLLQMLIFPLIITTLVAGVSSISPQRLGRIGVKVFVFYLVTSAFAITVGLALALAVSPGAGLSMPGGQGQEGAEVPSVTDTLVQIVPANPFQALVEGNVLAIMFLALVFGLALTFMMNSDDERAQEWGLFLRKGIDAAADLVFRVVRGVLEYAPVGVFALIAAVLAQTGAEAIGPLVQLTGVVYGSIVLMVGVYALILLLFRAPLGRFFAAAKDPMVTAFVTRSSGGTLPVSTAAARRMGVREGVYGFSLPLGATVNMDGTAIYVGAATVFVANIAGQSLGVVELATVVLVGVLASVGTAGVPGAGLVMLTMATTSVGLPMAPVALVAGIDALLDMARTMCNVTGDLAGTRVVAATEKGMLREPGQEEGQGQDLQRRGSSSSSPGVEPGQG
ncbi:amino acid transporter [Nocardiopsis kunsanensis]|uniref:Amino acid transporter n=1 Tax=Nocardiopsis kunsanensis TaxID=141693 RepID=A0A918X9D0_9ACTN|nr:dicarboxylate/amino acid:cation symporter [Nocardiopsis kunsanensis]GHD19678.1 amino acid transporter [Nocardiopsis kunsanensis]